jgi:hypothetical protein
VRNQLTKEKKMEEIVKWTVKAPRTNARLKKIFKRGANIFPEK